MYGSDFSGMGGYGGDDMMMGGMMGGGMGGMGGGFGGGMGGGGFGGGMGGGGGYGPQRTGGQGGQNRFNPMQRPGGSRQGTSATNLYISDLPTSWGESELEALCSPYGEIANIRVVTKPDCEANRGVAFVHFKESKDAKAACQGLNQTKPETCETEITVRHANASRNSSPPDFLADKRVNITRLESHGWTLESNRNLYVSGIPKDWSEKELTELFEQFGALKDVKRIESKKEGGGAVAFVHFEEQKDAIKAVAATEGTTPDGYDDSLQVKFASIQQKNYPHGLQPDHLCMMECTSNVFIQKFPQSWEDNDLKKLFEEFGTLLEVRILERSKKPGAIPTGFCHFKDSISACRAIAALDDSVPDGCTEPIMTKYAKAQKGAFGMGGGGGFGGGRGGGGGGFSNNAGGGFGGQMGGMGGMQGGMGGGMGMGGFW